MENIIPVMRDIAIIVLAVETIVIGAAVLFLLWQSWKLVGVVRRHAERLTGSAQEILGTVKETAETVKETAQTTTATARNVQGTASFVGDRVALPVIEFYSTVAGASRFANAVFSGRRGVRQEDDG